MTTDSIDIKQIAHLARLPTGEDTEKYKLDLDNILDLVRQMNQVDTDAIEPLAHPFDATQRLRPDQITETNQKDRLQKIAPLIKNDLYLVPKVIEDQG